MTVPLSYFVYYRVRPERDRDDAQAAVRAMQAALAARTGVAGRLLTRHGDGTTWMEVYEGVVDPTAFEIALDIETQAHHLNDLVQPGAARHMERFTECA